MLNDELVDIEVKQCNKCLDYKPITEFHKLNKGTRFSALCKKCYNSSRCKSALEENKARFKLGLKKCSKCDEVKSLDDFNKNKAYRDGFNSRCRVCVSLVRAPRNKGIYQKVKELYAAGLKKCSKCLEIKSLSEFHKHKSHYYGISSHCAECSKASRNKGIHQAYNERREQGLKKCTRCFEIKSLTEFHKNKNSKDGVGQYCKKCRTYDNKGVLRRRRELLAQGLKQCPKCGEVKSKEHYYKSSHSPDKLSPWCIDCLRAYNSKGILKEIEELHELGLKKCSHCLEILPVYNFSEKKGRPRGLRSWCKDCVRARNSLRIYVTRYTNYYDLIPSNDGSVKGYINYYIILDDGTINKNSLRLLRYVLQSNRCGYCFIMLDDINKSPNQATLDHIVPVFKKGKHSFNNVIYACRYCNISKGKKGLREWLWS